MNIFRRYFSPYFEAVVWITALAALAFMDPAAEGHFSICVFKWMGFNACPGCGLGHSISWLLRAEWEKSFSAHPLGLFAVMILVHRIYSIIKNRRVFLIPQKK